ncbi:MAG: hypothetical protein KIT56_02680 [Gammaproteobacteria bacterium]|nr:hypothetical protein [Gammaproteobacteria bacterium]MCW5582784.1 hypothetical protein [Gammaproteobacteria bacterium]
MDTVKFLETLATKPHHQINLVSLMSLLPVEIKKAYLMNDVEAIKLLISDIDYLANESHVVQIQP